MASSRKQLIGQVNFETSGSTQSITPKVITRQKEGWKVVEK